MPEQNPLPLNFEPFHVTAYNKRPNSSNYISILVLTFVSIGMMIVSAIVFQNWISAITILLCTVALILYYLQKPVKIGIECGPKYFKIASDIFTLEQIKKWDIIEGQDLTEVDIITSKLTSPFLTFYIPKSNFNDYNKLLDYLYTVCDFDQGMSYRDNFQNILRIVGLK